MTNSPYDTMFERPKAESISDHELFNELRKRGYIETCVTDIPIDGETRRTMESQPGFSLSMEVKRKAAERLAHFVLENTDHKFYERLQGGNSYVFTLQMTVIKKYPPT